MNNFQKLLIVLILPCSYALSMDRAGGCRQHSIYSWKIITPHNPCNHSNHCSYCCPEHKENKVERCLGCGLWLKTPQEFITPIETEETREFEHYCKRGNLQGIVFYLRNGFNPNYKNKDLWTPLMIATEQGNTSIVETLLAAGVDPNVVSSHGETALILAIASLNPNIAIIKTLLANKANPDIHGHLTLAPIIVALRKGGKDVVQLLLEAKANPNHNDDDYNPLKAASFIKDAGDKKEIIALLKQYGAVEQK